MAFRTTRRGAVAVTCGVGLSLVLAACGGGDGDDGDDGDGAAGGDVDCANFEQYGDLEGTTVTLYTSIVAPEDAGYIEAFKPFEECTGATVVYEGSKEFEAQIVVRVQSGNPPDVALFPQPGLLQTVVRDTGAVLPAPEGVVENVDQYYGEDWKAYGTVDDTFYAAPNSSNVKSFVWYSPPMFEEAGYEIPQTWDEMIEVSDQIVADGGKPWCAGIGSGDATGWPATDWMEDVMLRENGPDVYDQWVNHDIPFNDPQIASALERVGSILKNDDYVNGGLGDVTSIASTIFQDGGLPILQGQCWMHRQASFYTANWPEGTTVAEDGDVYAFYFPPISEEFGKPVLVGSEFVASFSDRPEVAAFQAYMASPEFVNLRAQEGSFTSANSELDPANVDTTIGQLSVEILQDENATIRFDASDLMPGEVGSGSFWTEMTNWIANDKPDDEVLDAIEASWP
jgi:alpha-glucoside transport system substrate-binding protein